PRTVVTRLRPNRLRPSEPPGAVAHSDRSQPRLVKAVLVTNDSSEPAQVVRSRLLKLLDSYVVESSRSGPAWFAIELAGAGRNAPLLSELAARHGAPDASIALILSCGPRAKYISYRELVTKEGGFRGEEAVTAGLIEVTEDKAAICYVTMGHGELGIEDALPERGMSLLSRQLRNRNFEVRQLNLATVAEVPRDAAMVLIAGPTTPFSASENARLKNYLYERNGRVLAMLDPVGSMALSRRWRTGRSSRPTLNFKSLTRRAARPTATSP
ncbi:hypothetical protein EMGBS6_10080, partial [Opitutia bacterium]